jgi:DNA-binding MarR family transcriptional regulator
VESLFDPVLVFSSRLAIMACLASGEPMSFTELSKASGLADGNLHVQTRKLEQAGYLSSKRVPGGGRRGRTEYQITAQGERRYRQLIATLEQSLERRPAPRSTANSVGNKDDSRVW